MTTETVDYVQPMTDEERHAWQFCGKLAEAVAEASGYEGPEDPPQLVEHVRELRAAVEEFCKAIDDVERHFGDEYQGRLAPLYELRDKVRGISDGSEEQK